MLRIAAGQALASLRHRAGRNGFTLAGIALGTGFYAAITSYRSLSDFPAGSEDGLKLAWFAWIALLMAAVGITNSMLISIAERTREIGTLKCLGASDGLVMLIVQFECLTLGVIGAALGGLIGSFAGASFASGSAAGSPLGIGVVCAALGLGMTLIASIFPTIFASRLPAVSALRVDV